MSEGLDTLANGIGKAIETVPELYQDAFQPTVQETGKLIARIPHAINAAFSGLDKWILNKEYSIEETKKLLAQKLENVEPEKIVEPEPYVAIPALQAISYSMNSDELRNLYANLLAKSMNIDTKDMVHPSFVEIIKQMSPIDASIFKTIFLTRLRPLIDLSIVTKTGNLNHHIYNISWITSYEPTLIQISFDNLIRLGLIEIPFGQSYADDTGYDIIRNTDYYIKSKLQLEARNLGTIHEEKQFIKCTALANSFYNICVIN